MARTTYISALLIAFVFVLGTPQAVAQNKRKVTTTKVVSKSPKRVSSRTVEYKRPTKKVTSVRTLPTKTVVKHNGINYYYHNHRYYTYSGGRYIVIPPKVGFRIHQLPVGYRIINHPTHPYFWAQGVFYIEVATNTYEVVEPEIGTLIYELPEDYEKVVIDGQTYYEFSNVLYEKVQVDGTRAYEVVGFIEQ